MKGPRHILPGDQASHSLTNPCRYPITYIEGGTYAAYRREIDSAPDPKARLAEIELRLKRLASPFRTAEAFSIEDIIDPRTTRPVLVDFIEKAQPVIESQLGPTMVPAFEP